MTGVTHWPMLSPCMISITNSFRGVETAGWLLPGPGPILSAGLLFLCLQEPTLFLLLPVGYRLILPHHAKIHLSQCPECYHFETSHIHTHSLIVCVVEISSKFIEGSGWSVREPRSNMMRMGHRVMWYRITPGDSSMSQQGQLKRNL